MASGSSAKKVARLASKGKGRKVRFQGGTVFPATMAVIIVLGLGLVVYARQSLPSLNSPPTVNDHWHVSYGFYACDQQLKDLAGTKEDPVDPLYQKYGVHSHQDGVIHWHPTALASGRRAKFGVFLETYGVKVSTDGIAFPNDQNDGKSYAVDTDKCKDKSGKLVDAQVSVTVWEKYDDPAVKKKYITDFDNIRIDRDGMAVMVAFTAPDTEVPMPASASKLPELGAVDSGAAPSTTVPANGSSTVPGAGSGTVDVTSTTTG
ncbi:MAG: hypothetical protein ACKO1X_02295 [Acidimicrobiales bacterium]